jgi:hypothetical protein
LHSHRRGLGPGAAPCANRASEALVHAGDCYGRAAARATVKTRLKRDHDGSRAPPIRGRVRAHARLRRLRLRSAAHGLGRAGVPRLRSGLCGEQLR